MDGLNESNVSPLQPSQSMLHVKDSRPKFSRFSLKTCLVDSTSSEKVVGNDAAFDDGARKKLCLALMTRSLELPSSCALLASFDNH